MKVFGCILMWPVLAVVMVACSSRSPDVVRKTIQTYRVGVTTFADFKKDAVLEEVKPDTDKPPTHSYLNPELDSLDSKIPGGLPFYTTSEKSPWKIFEESAESNSESHTASGLLFGKSSSSSSETKKSKFVVGDSKGPFASSHLTGRANSPKSSPCHKHFQNGARVPSLDCPVSRWRIGGVSRFHFSGSL